MRKSFFALFLTLIALNFACSQNPPKSPHLTVDGKDVKVVYGQPSKRGRVIFGADGSQSLEKYGKVWRAGADEATVITFKKDGMFGGKPVKAGDYGFFAIPGEKEWVVILNSEPKQWGAYNYKQDKDVLRITVPAMTLKEPVEKLTYEVKDNALMLMWDTAGFTVPLQF